MDKSSRDIAKTKSTAVKPLVERSTTSANDKRLAVMPLAVLLPRRSTLSKLSELQPSLQARQSQLQLEMSERAGGERGAQLRLEAEASMLHQLLQWSSIGER